MDPKLQTFLQSTGWSREDLIRKLSAGENTIPAIVNATDFVTSTTCNKDTVTPHTNNRLNDINARVNRHFTKKNLKTAKGIHKDAEIVYVDLDSEEPLPAQNATVTLTDDLLLQINTSNSYLPPINRTETRNRSVNDKSGVIDLDSDSESLEIKETHIDKDVERGNVIDISTDSDESVKAVDNLYDEISDAEIAAVINDSHAKKSKAARQLVKEALISKHVERELESDHWEKYVSSRLKDIDRHGRSHDKHIRSRRRRSTSGNRYREDRQRRNTMRRSRSRSHRSPSRSRRSRSQSTSSSHSSTSPRRSRSKRDRTRDRSQSKNRRKSSASKSQSNRSRSSSISRETVYRSRKRTRSIEGDNDWYSKVRKHERSVHPTDHMTTYFGNRISPPKKHLSDVPEHSTAALKDAATRFKRHTPKKYNSLEETLKTPNNLSQNKIRRSNTYMMFKNIVAEESREYEPKIESKSTTQKIVLKRRQFIIQSEDSTKKLTNTSSELGVDEDKISETTEKVSLDKNFVEMKDRHLSSEVSQLIASEIQLDENIMMPHSPRTNTEVPNIYKSINKIVEETDETIALDVNSNSPQNLQIPEIQYVAKSSTNIETENNNIAICTNEGTSEMSLSPENTDEVLVADKTDEVKQKLHDHFRALSDELHGKTYNTIECDKHKIHIVENIVIAEELTKVSEKADTNSVASQSTCEGQCTNSNSEIIKIPKLQQLAIESLSDISSGDLTDDIVDIINKTNKGNNKLDKGKIASDPGANTPITQNTCSNIYENLSDVSDDLTYEIDDSVTKKFQKGDSNDDNAKIKNNSSYSSVTVKNISEIVESASSQLNDDSKGKSESHDKVASSLETQHVTTTTTAQLVDDTQVVNYDRDRIVERQRSATQIVEESSVQGKNGVEIPVPEFIENLFKESQDESVNSIESQHVRDYTCGRLIDNTNESSIELEEDGHEKVVPIQASQLLASTSLSRVPGEQNNDFLNPIDELTGEEHDSLVEYSSKSAEVYVESDRIKRNHFLISISSPTDSTAKSSEDDHMDIINSPELQTVGVGDISNISIFPSILRNETESALTECQDDHDETVNSLESHILINQINSDHLLDANERLNAKSLNDDFKISDCNIVNSKIQYSVTHVSDKHEHKHKSDVPLMNLEYEVDFENAKPNKTVVELQNKIVKDISNVVNKDQELPNSPLVVYQSDKGEQTKVVTDSVERSMEIDKYDINPKPPETDFDESPSLDIEAILKKCIENQERALKEKAEQKDLPPIPIRRLPKNRRPDFSSLRDKSMSTVKINLMLEQLSYKNILATKDFTTSQIKKNENVNVMDPVSNAANQDSVSVQSIQISSDLAEIVSVENVPKNHDNIIISTAHPEINVSKIDLDTPFYDKNANDDIRNQILKQLDILKDRRNDFAFSTCIKPIIMPKLTRKKTFAKLRYSSAEHVSEEEINIVNEGLEAPLVWLTKTTDYKKIKGWKNKSIGVKTKKCSQPVVKSVEESFAIPSCSFHNSPIMAHIIETTEPDNKNEEEKDYASSKESKIAQRIGNSDVVDTNAAVAETNAFSSSMLDEFMLDKSEVELKISYEIPALLMGPSILESDTFKGNLRKGDLNHEASVRNEILVKDFNISKPRTLAEKRRLLKLEDERNILLKITNQSNPKQPVIKPLEDSQTCFKIPGRRTINDDVPNVGHNKRKDFTKSSVYWKGKRFMVPCRERKAIYFRTKVFSCYSSENSKNELSTPLNSINGNPIRNEVPPKAILWSPEKSIEQPVLRSNMERKQIISYKAGPMCKKPDLIVNASKSWECLVKPLPKVFLEITAEYGKCLHPRALQFLYAEPYVDLSQDKVNFALTALKDSRPMKYKLPVFYKNDQKRFTLHKKVTKEESQPKTPPACGDICSEVKEVVDDLLDCLEIQEIQETFIKDDPDLDTFETPKKITTVPCKKDVKESSGTTRVAAINKRLRIALGRLQVKFIDINIDDDPNRICDKAYCQLGCVCSSLIGALASKEHCRRIECVLGCICGYKPPVNTTITLPAGSDLDLSSTVDKLQSEATKNLAKVEREFTQTIVCTKNETYVLGDTTDRKRRCTRAPKKYEDFLNVKTVTKDEDPKQSKEEAISMSHVEYVRNKHEVDIIDCSVRIEKVDMYHVIPFCWTHEEYQCECLKEFLIARSEEKAHNLALQLYVDTTMQNAENNLTSKYQAGPKMKKVRFRRKVKFSFTKGYSNKRKYLNLNTTQTKMNAIGNNAVEQGDEEKDSTGSSSQSLEQPAESSIITNTPQTDVQDNQQPKSTNRRKQVLSTMVDVSEKHTVQVRVLKEPVPTKKLEDKSPHQLMQNTDRDILRFLLPTSNVRLQFLKMLGKSDHAKDEFRLLSFLVLSNRFHLNLFHVWYYRTQTTSKYILTMDNVRPSKEFVNVRKIPSSVKTDNYLIQWLIEGTIPVAEVQDFLVILKVINSKMFDICGMCEKSKIEYTDEPLSPLLSTPPEVAAKSISTPSLILSTPKPSVATVPTMTYDINGAIRHKRKILNIQNKKIPPISAVYPSVALTSQSGLIHASLPRIDAKFRWLMLSFSSTFAVLNMTTANYCIPHEYLVELAEESRLSNCTMMFKNREIRGKAAHYDFAIYVTPQHKKYFFIGPYHLNETLSCETLCYYKNMLVSTANFNKIHGNPVTPIGCWIKQLQMKVHSVATTPVVSPPLSLLKPIKPKTAVPSPPQLVKISDFIAAKKRKQPVIVAKQITSSPKTNLLIVNNSIISACTTVSNTSAVTLNEQIPTTATANSSSTVNTSAAPATVVPTGTTSNNVADFALVSNTGKDEISLLGLDYRDAEFKDKEHKTLQYLITNIPGFGYVRIYRCLRTNITYLMWRFVKMYKTLLEAKKALIALIENTVIIVPSNFKITISVLNIKPLKLKLINSDYYFDTYIAGKFGVHLLSSLSANAMINLLKLTEDDVQYINERSAGMLLKKCYNIASTFLTKDDLAKIRNWKDMLAALRGTIDSELQTDRKLTDELKIERYKRIELQNKLKLLTKSGNSDVTLIEDISEVIEISDDDNDDDDEELIPKLPFEVLSEGQSENTSESPIIQSEHGVQIQSPISTTPKTSTQWPSVEFANTVQKLTGSVKLVAHNQNSVLITRIKNKSAIVKTKTDETSENQQ